MKAVPNAGPYARAAGGYWQHGWAPIPLPPKRKYPPEKGWTGGTKTNSGDLPSRDQVLQWIASQGDGNVCIRVPKNVIGIDVDLYDGKTGGATLAAAEEAWGPLPPTWVSSSRTDGSGIRFFRVTEGLNWPGELPQGKGVELVKWDHRYAIVAPSIHPEGREYVWLNLEGEPTTEALTWDFPAIDDLPELPEAWVTGLTAGRKWTPKTEADLSSEEVTDWLKNRGDDRMCEVMERTVATHLRDIRPTGDAGGAHEGMTKAVWAIVGDAQAGHKGIRHALEKIQAAFREASKGRRSTSERQGEWRRSLDDAVRKIAAEGDPEDEDICEVTAVSRTRKVRGGGSANMDFERDDIGNGQRFAMQWRDQVRWVPELEKWFIWRDYAWQPDKDGEIDRMATQTVRAMRQEAQYIEDTKQKAAFLSFVRASSNDGKLAAMLKRARSNKGMTVSAAAFDHNPTHLVAPNATVDLPVEFSGAKVRRITSVQEHFNTIHTGTNFVPNAELPEWNKFLERFLPDEEIRNWLQMLAGYSLLGSNPRRLMVVALGDSSTGKTTFAEAVAGALGGYAGSANMTIFRDNQDDKARPDLLRVLPMRFVYAEEASRSWHLHPDQIKRLTGGAPITARAMRANEYMDRVPSFTPWLFSNHAPTIDGGDTALWRRMLVVPFDVVIPKNEEDARFRIALGSDGGRQAILAWLVRGYEMYLAAPDQIQEIPVGALAANAQFRAEVNDLSMCLGEITESGTEFYVRPDDLYQAYRAWSELNNTNPRDILSGTKFGREVNGQHPKKLKKIDGKPVWVRPGIRIKRGWLQAVGA